MTYTTAQDALLIMLALLKDYDLIRTFNPGFPGLQESMFIHNCLLKKYLPKLFNKFEEEGLIAETYCTQWYMTLFAVALPIHVVVRIWDVYLIEGPKTIFRISLAILKINEARLMESDMSDCLATLKEY